MKYSLRLIGLSVTLLAVLILAVPAAIARPQSNVSGQWDLAVTSPRGTTNPTLTLKADGDKLTGTLKGQRGEIPVTGTINGSDIKMTYSVKFQDNDLAITLTGKVSGDSMKGDADFGGFAQGDWSGKRHTGEAAAAAPAAAATSGKVDVTGNWVFEVETDQGSGTPSFTFKQDGEKLTGTYSGAFGEAPLQGTLKGDAISFTIKLNVQGNDAVAEYTGTIDGKDSMKGKMKVGDAVSGTWTGKRKN
ncbi:MAG: hypothetical protein ACREDR_29070 [Blastocatellia bacterium]